MTDTEKAPLEVKRDEKKGKIWSHLRNFWLIETPEERMRQEYLCVLVNEYDFQLEQMGEEIEVTGRGSGRTRADFVIWRSAPKSPASAHGQRKSAARPRPRWKR